jgi:hypothetical protein
MDRETWIFVTATIGVVGLATWWPKTNHRLLFSSQVILKHVRIYAGPKLECRWGFENNHDLFSNTKSKNLNPSV